VTVEKDLRNSILQTAFTLAPDVPIFTPVRAEVSSFPADQRDQE
jgi:hypothetical protein